MPIKKVETKTKRINELDPLLFKFKDTIDSVKETLECSCCYEDKSIDSFGQCSDGHIICNNCIKTHAQNTIYQKMSCKIGCINSQDKCYGNIDDSILSKLLDVRVFSEYKNLKRLDEMKELSIDGINIKMCQHCNAGTDIGESKQDVLVCLECFKDTCLKCNQIAHYGSECYHLGKINRGKRQTIEDKMTEAMILRCEKCSNPIVKDEGCNSVTCLCGNIICYVCKKTIWKSAKTPLTRQVDLDNISSYSHFCRSYLCTSNNCKQCHLYTKVSHSAFDAVKDDYNKETKTLIDKLL